MVVDLVLTLLLPASPSLVAPCQAVATSPPVNAHPESRLGDESNLVRSLFLRVYYLVTTIPSAGDSL